MAQKNQEVQKLSAHAKRCSTACTPPHLEGPYCVLVLLAAGLLSCRPLLHCLELRPQLRQLLLQVLRLLARRGLCRQHAHDTTTQLHTSLSHTWKYATFWQLVQHRCLLLSVCRGCMAGSVHLSNRAATSLRATSKMPTTQCLLRQGIKPGSDQKQLGWVAAPDCCSCSRSWSACCRSRCSCAAASASRASFSAARACCCFTSRCSWSCWSLLLANSAEGHGGVRNMGRRGTAAGHQRGTRVRHGHISMLDAAYVAVHTGTRGQQGHARAPVSAAPFTCAVQV